MIDQLKAEIRASVVVPVRGRPDELGQCLDGLLDQTMPASTYEILVCDDGSPDDLADAIRQLCQRDLRIRYLRQPPKGPAAARNLGVACARAEIVAFTDSDTLPQSTWLADLVAAFDDPDVVGAEGPVRTPTPADSPLQEAPRNETGGVHLTANMAYRRSALLAVGGLDESFPLAAFEDVDLALCVRKLGRLVFVPTALVRHPWRRITLESSLRRLRQLDWLLVIGLRHGCLGWIDRPTTRPRFRVALAAAVTLPLGRIRKGMRFLFRSPGDSIKRIGIAIIEAAIGLALLPRWLRKPYPVERHRYLDTDGAAA